MNTTSAQIILASASARRKILLQQIGVRFDVIAVDVDETPQTHEQPIAYVKRLAELKARTGFRLSKNNLPVLGADTAVVVDNHILGKPRNETEAVDMLLKLSDNTHKVMTAIAMINQEKLLSYVNTTDVHFAPITYDQAFSYWQTGEPVDKAGAYAIQGLAAMWVKEIKGSFSGVMGLPLYETTQLLKAFDVSV